MSETNTWNILWIMFALKNYIVVCTVRVLKISERVNPFRTV
jgi:hypothetical protein